MDRIVRGVRGEMAGHDHLSRNCLGEGGDGKLGWMKIAEEARDHLSGRNWSARLRFWSCWDTFAAEERKQEGRKEGIGERTCGRHVSWKRTARMMNLSRGRPRCTTLAGLLFAHRFPFCRKYFSPAFRFARTEEEPSRLAEQVSIFVASCKHGIAASRYCWKVLFERKFAGCLYGAWWQTENEVVYLWVGEKERGKW